jgi:ubiquinone/menaquinone biosynthesis C-methylase UbiE
VRAIEHERMFRFENQHFWFVGTRAVIRDRLNATPVDPRPGRTRPLLLDVGCGTGSFLSSLDTRFDRLGLDYFASALQFHRTRGDWALVQGSATCLPFADGSVDVVTALDVLEHLEDHVAAVTEIRRVLAPGGFCLATVPAFQSLFSTHDEALGHQRRYRREGFVRLFEEAGLVPEAVSYYNTWLFPALAATRLAKKALPRRPGPATSDLSVLPGPLNRALAALLGSERFVLRHARLPVGASIIGTFRRA